MRLRSGSIQSAGRRKAGRCRLWLALTLATGVLSASCDEKLSNLTGPTPDLEPTFSSIQSEIFESSLPTRCVNCHNAVLAPFNGGLNLAGAAAYGNLVNASSRLKPGAIRVIPNDPDGSYLIHKLEGRSGIVGARMPLNGPPFLTDGQILVIRRWIQLGAQNN